MTEEELDGLMMGAYSTRYRQVARRDAEMAIDKQNKEFAGSPWQLYRGHFRSVEERGMLTWPGNPYEVEFKAETEERAWAYVDHLTANWAYFTRLVKVLDADQKIFQELDRPKRET